MKYYIIAGEASGDLHGANLIKALKTLDTKSTFKCWGGDLMQNQGVDLVKHYKELAFMGFFEVLMNIRTITKNLEFCKRDISKFDPDVIIFIDYPGFNMRIAKWAKALDYKTHYYISPQLWAWKENRINNIKRDIDKMYVILPFEKPFYEIKHQTAVDFVGHPLLDAISNRPKLDREKFKSKHQLGPKPIVAILPGSRKQEIKKMLKVMLSVVDYFPKYQFVIAGAPSQDISFYQKFIDQKPLRVVSNCTYDLLSISEAALVTSGTATLETALFKIPEVVCYKTSWLSYQIGKRLVKNIKFISLVNLILDKELVTELIQSQCNSQRLASELSAILKGPKRQSILEGYKILEKKLGGKGASQKTAALILKYLT
jgi:lipid-A-disaccharide synthase